MAKVVYPRIDLSIKTCWYIVANRTRAIIYRGRPGHRFTFLMRFENPLGRIHESQLANRQAGQVVSSSGFLRHRFDKRHSWHENNAKNFAKSIANYLEKSLHKEKFRDLVIMAEPHFLGVLNQHLSRKVRSHVKDIIPKEWAYGSDISLEQYLQKHA